LAAGYGVTASEGNAIASALTLWTFSLEYVGAICSVDVTAGRVQALHAVGKLTVVSAGDSTMPGAPLVVPIDEADMGSVSAAVHEFTHV
jgi:hypothetical protein